MKRISTMVLALVMAAMFATRTQAQMKPLVTFSVASYDEMMADLDYLAGMSGQPVLPSAQIAGILQLMAGVSDPGSFFATENPTGVIIGVDGDRFPTLAFLPIKDPDTLFAVLGSVLPVAPQDVGNGVSKYDVPGGPSVFVKAEGDWLFAAQSADDLSDLPANPASILGDLPTNYNFGVTAHLQNIPSEYREQALAGLMEGLNSIPGQTDAQVEMMQAQIGAMEQLFEELDKLSIGFAIDADEKTIYLDINMSAVPGSSLARQMQTSTELTTQFGGFVRDNAMLSMSVVGEMAQADIDTAKGQLAQMRQTIINQMKAEAQGSEEHLQFMEEWMNDVMDLVTATIETGEGDMGLAVVGDDSISAVMGMHVASGDQAEALFDKMLDFIRNEGAPVDDVLKKNAFTVDGVRFHTITPPANEVDDEMRMIFGNSPAIAVGFGEDVFYMGFGTDISDTLKEMMAQSKSVSDKAVDPFRMSVSLASIMAFASKVSPEAAALAGDIQPGVDHIRITSNYRGVTAQTRVTVEEGVIKFAAAAAQKYGQMAAGGGL
ncbi:MAG: hypothetical protein MPJ50_01505 [Pirellulales bacterium]|nr:hypothetical protein [Pirellulales bacterium]